MSKSSLPVSEAFTVEPSPVATPLLIPNTELTAAVLLEPETALPEPAAIHRRAVLMLLAAALFWSFGGVLIKWIDWNPAAIAGMRSLIGAALIWAVFRRELKIDGSFEQIGGALAYAGTVVLFVVANKMTTAANTILLQYTAPLYVILFSPWFLGEQVSRRDWLILLVMIGGMILFFLDDLTLTGYWGNIIALIDGFCFGWMALFMRRQKDGSALSSLLLGNLIAGVIGLPFMFQFMPDLSSWFGLVLLGVVQLGLPYILFALALRHVRAVEGILIPMIEPVLNPVWVFLMMGEKPGVWALLGGAIILGAVMVRARR
ncbi:MAG TPA: DMT family transporter [Candidatus Competibacteraceae bacterium]|nr:DMT family transporter [Candidatus Competibacteraceae bacterium]HRY19691.1 DMT family transporter [Candidatus Competibacteraceae bacterium]